jgi:neutral ceramidase
MKNLISFSIFLSIIFLFGSASNAADMPIQTSTAWKAGVARVKITPEEHMWMAGYAFRNKPSEGKLTDLWAKALILEDAEWETGGHDLPRSGCYP